MLRFTSFANGSTDVSDQEPVVIVTLQNERKPPISGRGFSFWRYMLVSVFALTRPKTITLLKILQAENQRSLRFLEDSRYLLYEVVSVESVGLEEELDTTEETFCIARTFNVFALEVLTDKNDSVHRSPACACDEAFGACISIIPLNGVERCVRAEVFVTCPDSPLTPLGILIAAAVEVAVTNECLPRFVFIVGFGVLSKCAPDLSFAETPAKVD